MCHCCSIVVYDISSFRNSSYDPVLEKRVFLLDSTIVVIDDIVVVIESIIVVIEYIVVVIDNVVAEAIVVRHFKFQLSLTECGQNVL